jgi:hypothetical protein
MSNYLVCQMVARRKRRLTLQRGNVEGRGPA